MTCWGFSRPGKTMKFYVKIAIVVGLLILLLWFLQDFGHEEARPVASTSTATPVSTVVVSTPTPAPTPIATIATTLGQSTLPPCIPQGAQGARVQITAAQFVDGWWYVTVVGRERQNLYDFLDAAQRGCMRDMDEKYTNLRQFQVRGEPRAQATYKMRF